MKKKREKTEQTVEAKGEKEPAAQSVEPGPPRAILVELENISANGREVVYEALDSVLTAKGIKISLAMFSRYCVGMHLREALPRLLAIAGKTRLSKEKLFTEAWEKITASFEQDSLQPAPVFKRLSRLAAQKNISLGALALLDLEKARQLAARVGFPDTGSNLVSCMAEQRICPGADAWLKVAKGVSVLPALCVVIASCATSCKGALSAGMRCVAIPDEYTSFQDFSGADYVASAFDDSAIDRAFALVESF